MQRYFAKDKTDNEFILEATDLHHIKNVMRMSDLEEIEVVHEKIPYLCNVKYYANEIKIILNHELTKKEEFMPKINLIIPLLKEQKMDLILQKSTELGVYEITPVNMEHSIIKIDNKKEEKKLERWKKICKEASEQSFRDEMPIINSVQNIDELALASVNIICSTREKSQTIKNILKTTNKCDKINVVIGPEGGLSVKEEEKLIKKGFIPITLGNRIMRVETVPLFILSVLNYEFQR